MENCDIYDMLDLNKENNSPSSAALVYLSAWDMAGTPPMRRSEMDGSTQFNSTPLSVLGKKVGCFQNGNGEWKMNKKYLQEKKTEEKDQNVTTKEKNRGRL